MREFAKRLCSIMVAACMLLGLAACNGSENQEKQNNATSTGKLSPAADGKVLEITVWSTLNNGEGFYKGDIKEDIVAEELAKKTGVKVTKMITTGSMKTIEKFNLLYATNEVPEVIVGWMDTGDKNLKDVVQKMIKDDMIWTWSDDEIKKLAPDAYGLISPLAYELQKGIQGTDKNVCLLHRAFGVAKNLADKYPEFARKKDKPIAGPNMPRFRDDILKEIIPTAKTVKELEEIYQKNGKLTWNDIYIPELDTYEEFISYLYKVKEKYGASGVIPYAPHADVLNSWSRAFLGGTYYATYNPVANDVNIVAVDKREKFNGLAKDLNKLFNEGIIDKNYAIDKDDQYKEKLNSGKFAVAKDGNSNDPNTALLKSNQPFRYRNVPVSYNTAENIRDGAAGVTSARCGNGFVLNKKKLVKAAMEKVMKYFNYQATEEGANLIIWGPQSSGLWEIKDGKRQWKDTEFADVVAGKKPIGQMKDFAYYGLQPGGPGTMDAKYSRDYFFFPHWDANPLTGDTVSASKTFNLFEEIKSAAQEVNKTFYDDNYSAWNGTTPTNKVFWDNWQNITNLVNKSIVVKPNEFDAKYAEVWKSLEEVSRIKEYEKEQKGYIDWIKKYKDQLRFHPKADMSKLK